MKRFILTLMFSSMMITPTFTMMEFVDDGGDSDDESYLEAIPTNDQAIIDATFESKFKKIEAYKKSLFAKLLFLKKLRKKNPELIEDTEKVIHENHVAILKKLTFLGKALENEFLQDLIPEDKIKKTIKKYTILLKIIADIQADIMGEINKVRFYEKGFKKVSGAYKSLKVSEKFKALTKKLAALGSTLKTLGKKVKSKTLDKIELKAIRTHISKLLKKTLVLLKKFVGLLDIIPAKGSSYFPEKYYLKNIAYYLIWTLEVTIPIITVTIALPLLVAPTWTGQTIYNIGAKLSIIGTDCIEGNWSGTCETLAETGNKIMKSGNYLLKRTN